MTLRLGYYAMKNQDKGSAALGRTIVFNSWAEKKIRNEILYFNIIVSVIQSLKNQEMRVASYEPQVMS